MTFSFKLRGETIRRETLADLSGAYCEMRDASGEGASTFPTPLVRHLGVIGRLSYNGRIWASTSMGFDNGLLFDNRLAA